MTNKISSCLEYLADHADFSKNFPAIAEVKTRSIITACGETPDLVNDTFLVIGQSIIPYGLRGSDVTVIDGYRRIANVDCIQKRATATLEEMVSSGIKFDWVIAPDEWLTYFTSEDDQRNAIQRISRVTKNGFFTTSKDYKNMHASQRYFEEPFVLRTTTGDAIIVRRRVWDHHDRQKWSQENFVVHGEQLYITDPVIRRTMYFKQMAKFSSDAGAISFKVEKDNMYKPMFSKIFEYVVCIKF